jgi:folate-binding protein YgfZ
MPELDLVIDRTRLELVRHGALVVTTAAPVFRIEGSGALSCMQGLLTNDLLKPGEHSLVYGALLTPKGMIVVDAWVLRQPHALTVVLPGPGHDAAVELFRRQLPPRLARVTDLTGDARVAWVLGEQGFQALAKSGTGVPEAAGKVAAVSGDLEASPLALAPEGAPFVAMAVGSAAAMDRFAARLVAAGAAVGEERDLHAARVLHGWPALGVEIDERTLPQEVRYDEIGGVSYTKGCYTGQETVARLHFRGHTNRELRGVRWPGSEPIDGRAVSTGEKEVGTVRSTLRLDDRTLGLALLRREVGPGDEVVAGGRRATVVSLPFGGEDVEGENTTGPA